MEKFEKMINIGLLCSWIISQRLRQTKQPIVVYSQKQRERDQNTSFLKKNRVSTEKTLVYTDFWKKNIVVIIMMTAGVFFLPRHTAYRHALWNWKAGIHTNTDPQTTNKDGIPHTKLQQLISKSSLMLLLIKKNQHCRSPVYVSMVGLHALKVLVSKPFIKEVQSLLVLLTVKQLEESYKA